MLGGYLLFLLAEGIKKKLYFNETCYGLGFVNNYYNY